MAIRAFWKGYLKLSLVTCPVTLTPAVTDAEKVRFRTIDRKTGRPVESRYIDAVTGRPVADEDEVKGYERGDDTFVLLEDEDLEAVALETTRTINIEKFVPDDSIGWLWYDRPHYLKPDDAIGEEAFSVIREAMAATNTVGISRLVMYRRERAILLKPRGNGIVLWTLRNGDEVRDPDDHFNPNKSEKPDSGMMKLTTRLIEKRTVAWNPSMINDPVQDKLKQIIASKKKGRKKPAPATSEKEKPAGNVVNIMDALRRSIDSSKGK